ncbi:MAG TPA: hypothetical protein VFF28_03655 [Candidatus Nanoarchaeia archaeon]|nr:hypothetical protein [Candidatus Nanoarchaeia archaeon]
MKLIILFLFAFLAGCASTDEISQIDKAQEQEAVMPSGNCTQGWICSDLNKKGYQFQDCIVAQETICQNGCKDGECLTLETKQAKTYTITQGMGRMQEISIKSVDFSENIFLDIGAPKLDVSIKLSAPYIGYTFFTAESPGRNLWIIDKKITEAGRKDCIDTIADAAAIASFYSGKTLCIKTTEKNIALVGGFWQGAPDENTWLSWKYYS